MGNSNFWGGQNGSNKYMMLMGGSTPASRPEELIAHTLTNFNNEQIDRVTAITIRKERGVLRKKQVVLAAAQQTGVTFTVGFGAEGEIYTPLLRKIRRGDCELDIYVKRLCPDKPEQQHFYAALEAIFNKPTFVNDLITINDDAFVTQQAEAIAPTWIFSHYVGAFRVADLTPPLYAVAVMTQECQDCNTGEFNEFVAVGGAGGVSDAAYVAITDDRFGSVTTPTTGIATGNSVMAVWTSGDTILIGFSDDPALATAASGGTAISTDRGVTWQLDSNISAPIFAVGYFNGQYVAAGGPGGGQSLFYVSDDGITWTSVVSSALPATYVITSLAVDTEEEAIYLTGEHGTFLKGAASGGTITFAAITPTGVGTSDLFRVAVMGDDHIAVGGDSGFYAESFDGGDSWVNPSVPGSTDIYGIAGMSKVRAVIGTDDDLVERSILSDNAYTPKTVENGITISGKYRDIQSLPGEHEYFVAVTDAGEVVLFRSFEPGS